MKTYNQIIQDLKTNANIYISMYEKDLHRYKKAILNTKNELKDKIFNTNCVYYRMLNNNHNSPYKYFSRKRIVTNVVFTKNCVIFTFKDDMSRHYFKIEEYGIKWVVDKNDYLPYLNIIKEYL